MTPNPSEIVPRAPQRLWAARLVILVAFLDLFMQFPIVAPYARSLGASAALVGIVVAMYSATNLVGNLIAGVVPDRWGRRRPVFGGLLGTAAALLGYALARAPGQLLAARAVHGLMAAALTPGAFAIIGDSAAVDRRARVMGVSGAIIAIAAVVGPSVAGVMRDRVSFQAVFLLSAALMLMAFAVFWRLGQETAPATQEARAQNRQARTGFSALLVHPQLVAAYLAALALTVGLGTLVAHLPIVMAAKGESSMRSGLAFTAFAIVAMIAMAGPLNRLSDRYGRLGPMAVGLAVISAGMLVLGASGDVSGAMLGMGVFGLGFGVLFPAVTALVAEAVGRNERGTAFGIFYAVYSLGVVIGSVVSGLLAEHLGELSGVPFLVSMAVALVAVPAIIMSGRRNRGETMA